MVGIMFTLGEVLCRFCLLTGHKDMVVLHDRTIFLMQGTGL